MNVSRRTTCESHKSRRVTLLARCNPAEGTPRLLRITRAAASLLSLLIAERRGWPFLAESHLARDGIIPRAK